MNNEYAEDKARKEEPRDAGEAHGALPRRQQDAVGSLIRPFFGV